METKFIMLIGLPGSGKSFYAKKIVEEENINIHSSDDLREEMFGNVDVQDKNGELFQELHKRIKNDLIKGNNVIYDACNISYKRRKTFLDELQKINCQKICYLIATPYEECLEYNSKRDRKVPDYVIKRMYMNFYIPQYYEGWDQINIVYNTNKEYNYAGLLKRLELISQDNPHHTLTIGGHCLKCASNTYIYGDEKLYYAALLHDIGKEFTKVFTNLKGEKTDIAHYYQHHLVSAYDTLFYLSYRSDLLKIVKYITWHMHPFFMKEQKTVDKFIKLVGQEFYDKLMLLHEADVNAK